MGEKDLRRATESGAPAERDRKSGPATQGTASLLPVTSLPKGGGALAGIGEKFASNPATGTCALSVPLALSPGRPGHELHLELQYDTGAGNGPVGMGWRLSAESISRKTDKGIPRYADAIPDDGQGDIFILAGSEDLIPVIITDDTGNHFDLAERGEFSVQRYRPRVEGDFARIERWTQRSTGDTHFRVVSRQNVTQIFGLTPEARVFDVDDPRRVFSWLLQEVRDDRGNVTQFIYKGEDGDGLDHRSLHELGRWDRTNPASPKLLTRAARYLKRIRYGNRLPLLPTDAAPSDPQAWLFEAVFDYGEHDPTTPTPDETTRWNARSDAFSSYRAGFEVRTYRLCQRVLMFHRFAELGDDVTLVRATRLLYDAGPVTTYLTGVVHLAYERDPANPGRYLPPAELPTLVLDYERPSVHQELRTLDALSAEGLPEGIDGNRAQWVDLDGEGIPGVLHATEQAFLYKRNLGAGRLAPPALELSVPVPTELTSGVQQLVDLAGDGQLDLVQYRRAPLGGFFERTPDRGWEAFASFSALPDIDWSDPNLRFVDVDGDGLPDVLITEDHAFVWYRFQGKSGFEPGIRVNQALSEEHGPALLLHAEGLEVIELADMSGDGLPDIVRIRNGEVCYWPNLGYGRFGRKVSLDHAPTFAPQDEFDPRRIRLGDIDGSGTTDIVYCGRTGIAIYFNQSGNGLSAAQRLDAVPVPDALTTISLVDVLGQGTATLVFSRLSDDLQRASYVDLMGGKKPHLLTSLVNNLGAETRIWYAPATKFYLADKAARRPWLTRLPFPVQVVERIEHVDRVNRTHLITTYRYHHGFFDGFEREFRGFAMVEQFDAESFSADRGIGLFPELADPSDPSLRVPPIQTKTWFHTGAWLEKQRLELGLSQEYYAQDSAAVPLPNTALPSGLTAREQREATRALRGLMLRREVYANDGGALATHPFSVSEHTYQIRTIQRVQGRAFGSFLVSSAERLERAYERDPADPRTTHELSLELDDFGNVTQSVSIAYPRRQPAEPEQQRLWATFTESSFVNVASSPDFYRLSLPVEARVSELSGLGAPGPAGVFSRAEVLAFLPSAVEIPFESAPSNASIERRLIRRARTLYYDENLGAAPLPLGQVNSRGLVFEVRQQAFTDGLLSLVVAGRLSASELSSVLIDDARYLRADGVWWVQSGRVIFDPTRFFLPIAALDPFGQTSTVDYDAHSLFVTRNEDALHNVQLTSHDYRVLRPQQLTDSNGNRTTLTFDTLGLVASMALRGKDGALEGDTVSDPTVRYEYDVLRWQRRLGPVVSHVFQRERHGSDNPRFQESHAYSDGSGREVMLKLQAEPGLAPARDARGVLLRDANGALVQLPTDARWVGSGRTVFDNKGNPVKQYEPFFSSTSDYEDEDDLVASGVTPLLHYDPLGRLVHTEFPDGSATRLVIGAFSAEHWDQNDTLSDGGGVPWLKRRLALPPDHPDRRAAELAQEHAGTPLVESFDGLGRVFLSVADNGTLGRYRTHTELDVDGKALSVTDPRGVRVMAQIFDMLGRSLRSESAEAGQRTTLPDVMGKPLRSWDGRGRALRRRYDALQRPTHVFVTEPGDAEILVERIVYGEAVAQPESANLRGKPFRVYDSAGLLQSDRFDFKANLLQSHRRLALEYRKTVDWSPLAALSDVDAIATVAEPLLSKDTADEAFSFGSESSFDALNRIVTHTTPDGSVSLPTYNEANLLESLQVRIRGAANATTSVANIDYNARGQRERFERREPTLPNQGTLTVYDYDPQTFRLRNLHTTRLADAAILQDLTYTYDAAGNVMQVSDAADSTLLFARAPVSPDGLYEYDALNWLISAEGREHPSQQVIADDPVRGAAIPHPNDAQALRRYVENYDHDASGNITRVTHQAGGDRWVRRYDYGADNNRLLATSGPGQNDTGSPSDLYAYDEHGNMSAMPHLAALGWDYADRLTFVDKGGGGQVYFTYDPMGQRVRKVWEHSGLVEERIYLGGWEIFRRHRGSDLELARETLHVMDDKRRIALVETKTVDTVSTSGLGSPVFRYQLENNLGSSLLEVTDRAQIINYEEYYAYGATSFHAADASLEASTKRYRYIGKEKDEETGLTYHGARYCASWLGRWTSADPAGLADGTNVYSYARNGPLRLLDSTGLASDEPDIKGDIAKANRASYAALVERGQLERELKTLENKIPRLEAKLEKAKSGSSVWDRIFDRKIRALEKQLKAAQQRVKAIPRRINQLQAVIEDLQGQPDALRDADKAVRPSPRTLSPKEEAEIAREAQREIRKLLRPQKGGNPPAASPKGGAPAPSAPEGGTPPPGSPKPGGGAIKGGIKAVAPMVITIGIGYAIQKNFDEAARERETYVGPPTPQQIERQREVGIEFTGRFDDKNHPIFQYEPNLRMRVRDTLYYIFSMFQPIYPGGERQREESELAARGIFSI